MARVAVVLVSAMLIVAGVTWSARRVSQLEQHELEHESRPQTLLEARSAKGSTTVSARLDQVKLRAGENAVFEVCSADGMPDEAWRDALDFVVFQLEPLKLLLRVPLDQAHLDVVKRNSRGGCLALGGGPLEASGVHAIDAVWPGKPFPQALAKAKLRVRVMARQPLTRSDRTPILLIAAGALLLVLGMFVTRLRQPQPAATHASASHTSITLALGFAVIVAGWFASAHLGPFGPTWGLIKTAALAAIEVATAIVLAFLAAREQPVADTLQLNAPARLPWLALAAAPLFGLLLMYTARIALRLVPSTGESAIETFISWPSGMLAFAAIGVLVPVCEEIFFRGFVYGRALVFGNVAAFSITAFSFVALHAAQTWGNWGSLLSITITGLVLTGLRAGTGSTLIPALAHVVYNLGLTLRSL